MKVGILGAWHLGIVVASCLSDNHDVFVSDAASQDSLSKGIPTVDEMGVADILKKQLNKKIHLVHAEQAIKNKDYIIIAHDSPVDEEDIVDVSPIMESIDEIKKYHNSNPVIIIMSQIPVGTSKKIQEELKLPVVYVPENLRLGTAIADFKQPDVVVIGSTDKKIAETVSAKLFSVMNGPRQFMNLESAELWKHSMNVYLATNITLGNEIADICEKTGANATHVVTALKMDSRISKKTPLGAGLGFGGGTLGRDVNVLSSVAKQYKTSSRLFDAIIADNKERNATMIKKLGPVKGKKIAVFGLAYKPGTNTLRRSLGLDIAILLQKKGANVAVFDPVISEAPGFKKFDSALSAVQNADVIMLVTAWPQFKILDWHQLRKAVKIPFIFDCQNMMTTEQIQNIKEAGFIYSGVGYATQE